MRLRVCLASPEARRSLAITNNGGLVLMRLVAWSFNELFFGNVNTKVVNRAGVPVLTALPL